MAVDAGVEPAGVGVAHDRHTRSEVRSGVLLAMRHDWQDAEVGAISRQHDILHRARRDFPRRDAVCLSVTEALDDTLGGGIESECQVFLGREQVRHHGHRVARHTLEHQHRDVPVGLEPLLHRGELPPWVDFAIHAHQQLGRIPLEHVEKRSEVRCHERDGIRSVHPKKGSRPADGQARPDAGSRK